MFTLVATLHIQGFPLSDWQTNSYLVWIEHQGRKPAWIVDVGDRPAALLDAVRRSGAEVEAILFTHAHLDHIMGLPEVLRALGDLPRYAHAAEHSWFADPLLNLSALADVPPVSVAQPTGTLAEGDAWKLGPTSWRVLHTPGHSPGSISLVCDEASAAIVGDTLFAGSVGRSDFPTSDPRQLNASLARLLQLDDRFAVHPGHGPSTTIGAERRGNPFLR
jgi:glyoxylase-like metal-dependent hydrolase (beta-lactamase superfamily II)